MSKQEFKAESKRLLELMIHSIYTNKEIFLRELISNASDATDKRYFQSVQAGGEALNRDELPIIISIDKDARTITIEDNGCGMTPAELEGNLGTIAQSGSLDFKESNAKSEDIDIIGQFGVGFYSAFMVSSKVEVYTRTLDANDKGSYWVSTGVDGYSIEEKEIPTIGTKVVLTLMKSTEEDNYDEFLDTYYIRGLVEKYSDYIRYPIQMMLDKSRPKEGGDEGETESYSELTTVNSRTPIWKKSKAQVTDEEYGRFYQDKFHDYSPPQKVIYTSTEGAATYDALLFIPSHPPMNYLAKDYKKGLQLYTSGVLIMDHCEDLIPDHFAFVRGVVDSQDLSLNISREMLQESRQLHLIRGRLEKKIQSELLSMQKSDREGYNKFFKHFGVSIKYGIYESYGANRELLEDLLVFESSSGKMVTLKEYVSDMPTSQKYIYFASGSDVAQLENLPAAEAVMDKGYQLLYLTEQIDEFTLTLMSKYDEKEFRSITGGDLGLESEEEKKQSEEKTQLSRGLLDFLKEALSGKVEEVALSSRLKSHPVCLASKGEISLEMEKVLNSMPGNPPIKAQRVLELNPDHKVFAALEQLLDQDNKEKLSSYANILYNQALLLEGLPLEDPAAYTQAVSDLLV